MGKTIYFTATSVDGFIADEHNSLDWLFEVGAEDEAASEETAEHALARFFDAVGAFAMGATTYQWVLDHESFLEEPQKWQGWYGDRPCWVFTHRALPAIPGADLRFVQGDVVPVHEQMREAAGARDIWLVGGGELVGAFADAELLDEIQLSLQPVFLGGGAPLLPRRLTSKRIHLASVERTGPQVQLTYRVD